MEGVKRTVKLFSREPRERTRGHGHKLKYRKFHSKPKKKTDFSSCEVGETDLWRVWSLHPWRYSEPGWHGPEQPALLSPALTMGVDCMISRGILQPQLFFNSATATQNFSDTWGLSHYLQWPDLDKSTSELKTAINQSFLIAAVFLHFKYKTSPSSSIQISFFSLNYTDMIRYCKVKQPVFICIFLCNFINKKETNGFASLQKFTTSTIQNLKLKRAQKIAPINLVDLTDL